LPNDIREKRFRSDLYFRLAVAVLRIPPLRERGDDVGLLLDAALARANDTLKVSQSQQAPSAQNGDAPKMLSDSAKRLFLGHSWPGNVRELFNTVLRAAIWSGRERVIDEDRAKDAILSLGPGRETVLGRPLGNGFSLDALLREVEGHYLRRADARPVTQKAKAGLLGFPNYQTFSRRLERLGQGAAHGHGWDWADRGDLGRPKAGKKGGRA
jgi:DNA-binding NtrC family response regulator